jgi:hypothetical protein
LCYSGKNRLRWKAVTVVVPWLGIGIPTAPMKDKNEPWQFSLMVVNPSKFGC